MDSANIAALGVTIRPGPFDEGPENVEGDSTVYDVYAPCKGLVYIFLPSPGREIKNRTRAREPPRYCGPIRANHKKQKHLHPCLFSVTIRTMPLPPSPDSPATPEFVGTGRIYYPIPYATRLAPWGITGRTSHPATVTELIILANITPTNQVIKSIVCFTFNLPYQQTSGQMDLNEWQKLPPVPPLF